MSSLLAAFFHPLLRPYSLFAISVYTITFQRTGISLGLRSFMPLRYLEFNTKTLTPEPMELSRLRPENVHLNFWRNCSDYLLSAMPRIAPPLRNK